MQNAPQLDDIEGLDDMLGVNAAPIQVMGQTPQNQPRPAFTLTKMPPRERTVIIMTAQYEAGEVEDGPRKLVGFVPVQKQERVEGGYMLRAMKGHSVFIASYAELVARNLHGYVPLLSADSFDGPVMQVPPELVTRGSHKEGVKA